MEITQKGKEERPTLNREEVKIEISDYKETPSRQKLKEKVAAELGYDEEKIVINQIQQKYGMKKAECKINIYKTKEDLEKYSKPYKKERTQEEEEE